MNQYLQRIATFCAYQERTHQEVKEKLQKIGCSEDKQEEVIVWLLEENFLNEERFARVFAGSKFRVKQWGKVKIEQELRFRGLSEYCIRAGLSEIDEADYHKTLKTLLQKKAKNFLSEKPMIRNQKLARFALSKGYEPPIVWDILKIVNVQ